MGERRYDFWGALRATTGLFYTTDTDDFFPDEDFFPDISSLYENMGDNGDIPNANMGSSSSLYVFLFIIFCASVSRTSNRFRHNRYVLFIPFIYKYG
jgi:hypothetical protein